MANDEWLAPLATLYASWTTEDLVKSATLKRGVSPGLWWAYCTNSKRVAATYRQESFAGAGEKRPEPQTRA